MLVHCNGVSFPRLLLVDWRLSEKSITRRNQSLAGFRCDVRHAVLSDIMGRCIASRSESKILHISEWWISDTNQGASVGTPDILRTNQLQEYEAIYKANLAVAAYPVAQRTVSRRKRNDEDDEEDSNR